MRPPGWGDSDIPDDEADESGYELAEFIIEFLDALGADKAAFVGNSLGGLTSIAAEYRAAACRT
jgi:2-hydroxy-6-oxonona-2,4-dienedioate hydrolase